jgi:hypothetical protein
VLLTAGGSGNTGRDGWLGYVSGELGDDWPVSELEGALTCLAGRVAEMRADPTTHNSRLSDDMNHINPALTGAWRFKLGGRPVLSAHLNVETAGSEPKRPEF